MRILSFLLGGVAAAAPARAASNEAGSIRADDAHFTYMGRIAMVDGAARMGFPGVTIRFVYRGPAPTLRIHASSGECYFNLTCNGWAPVVLHVNEGDNDVLLPSGRAPDRGVLVELVRRNESWQGVATFQGVTLPGGCELLTPPAWPTRKMMFIGDSITCGESIELLPPETKGSPRYANAGRSYGMLLGHLLNAQVDLVSYGGRGVMRDWQGKTDTGNAPQFFQLALPDDPTMRWNHASYVPDVVVVCLGQNDFSSGLPDEKEYTGIYDHFIGDIRKEYPKAAIVLTGSPMQGDTPGTLDRAKRDQLRRTLDAVAAKRAAAGDTRIAVADMAHYPGTSSNAHPVAFQHEQIANQLLGPIRKLAGW